MLYTIWITTNQMYLLRLGNRYGGIDGMQGAAYRFGGRDTFHVSSFEGESRRQRKQTTQSAFHLWIREKYPFHQTP